MAAVACGSDNGGAASGNDATAVSSPQSQVAASSSDTTQTSSSGIDPACAEQVIGRTVTNFTDITEAERTRIFAQCSSGAPGPQGGFSRNGGPTGVGFDPACVEKTLGGPVDNVTDLTAEQRSALFQACGGGAFRAGDGSSFTFRGLDSDCVEQTLGSVPDNLADLSEEDRTAVLQACGNGLPDNFDPSQFGQGRRTFGTGGADFSSLFDQACVQDTLGHAVDDFTQLTQEERQKLFTACAPDLPAGGFGGFGGGQGGPGGFGGQSVDPTQSASSN